MKALLQQLTDEGELHLDAELYRVGKTLVFFKDGSQLDELNRLRELRLPEHVFRLQSLMRMAKVRRHFLRLRASVVRIRGAFHAKAVCYIYLHVRQTAQFLNRAVRCYLVHRSLAALRKSNAEALRLYTGPNQKHIEWAARKVVALLVRAGISIPGSLALCCDRALCLPDANPEAADRGPGQQGFLHLRPPQVFVEDDADSIDHFQFHSGWISIRQDEGVWEERFAILRHAVVTLYEGEGLEPLHTITLIDYNIASTGVTVTLEPAEIARQASFEQRKKKRDVLQPLAISRQVTFTRSFLAKSMPAVQVSKPQQWRAQAHNQQLAH